MRLIEEKFRNLKKRSEGALIGFIICGDPTLSYTLAIVHALIEGGIDMLELGIPFSDPIVDGPVIQRATLRALKAGVRPSKVLDLARRIHIMHPNIPIIILTYYNIIFRMGLENFFNNVRENKIDGVIVPDMPIEESSEYRAVADRYDVATIFLAAPSTSDERLEKIIEYSSGFTYLVSVFGVTGARERLRKESINFIRRASSISNGRIPIAVGFGISKPSHIRAIIDNGADGAIVGSKIIQIIEGNINNDIEMLSKLKKYVRILKKSTINDK
ncbi:MAG: tryptophan synthase subunit alpha [Candidatus Bathyarchaeia archaeon]|nr:tryptophan synthase subunit alpha [Candidatus Bathyarchaeota archaeon]